MAGKTWNEENEPKTSDNLTYEWDTKRGKTKSEPFESPSAVISVLNLAAFLRGRSRLTLCGCKDTSCVSY